MSLYPKSISIALFCYCLLNILSPNPILAQDLSLKTSFESQGIPNEEIYGFNTAFMFNIAAEQQGKDIVLKDEIIPILDEVAPNVLRFPGGTIANYYHFNDPGYGVTRNELPFGVIAHQIGQDYNFSKNIIIPFATAAKAANSEVLYVLNMRSHFFPINFQGYVFNPGTPRFKYLFKENMDAMRYLMDNNVNVVGVELGNEHYFDGIMTKGIEQDSLKGLMQLSKMYADSIRHYWPHIKISVPMPHNNVSGLYKTFAESTLKYDFYDAVAIHLYLGTLEDACPYELSKSAYFDCAETEAQHYIDNHLNYIETEYFSLLKDLGKKVWLTEWNINNPERVSNTFFQTTFLFRFFHRLLDIDTKLDGVIEYATFHTFLSGGTHYPIIAPLTSTKEIDTLTVHGRYTYKSSYFAIRLFKDLLNGEFEKIKGDLLDESGASSSELQSWTYFDRARNHLKLYFLNNGENEVSINMTNALLGDSIEYFDIKNMSMTYSRANDPSAFAGIAYDNAQYDDYVGSQISTKDNIVLNPGSSLDIPKFTLGYLDIFLEEPPFRESGIDTFFVTESDCRQYLNFTPSYEGGNIKYSLDRWNPSFSSYQHIQDIYVTNINQNPEPYLVEIEDPFQGNNQYRLQLYQQNNFILEKNAEKEYSCIIDNNVELALALSPTLTIDVIKASIESSGVTYGQIIISEISSGPILQQNVFLNEGANQFDFSMLNINNASAGYYTFTIIVGDQSLTEIFLFLP